MRRYSTFIVILVLVAIAIWVVLPNNPGIFGREISTHLGLDLVGGVQALLEADLPEGSSVTSQDMSKAQEIVENRVNGLGVSETLVQRAGDRRIVVEIPGVIDPDQAISTIKTTALLEFVDFSSATDQEINNLIGKTIETNFGQVTTPTGVITPTATAPVTSTVETSPITPTLPAKIWPTVMTGDAIKAVAVQVSGAGQYEVAFELFPEGSKTFADFTASHIGDRLAIVFDKNVISAPSINSAIDQGTGVITGGFTQQSANNLAVQLRSGSLPIPLRVAESRTVGPTLGQDSLRKSLVGAAIGLGLVVLFMILYYRLPGFLADLALVVYALIAFALFRLIPVTLTLPGIAGFVLSIGMAVDANILIFERLKEELRAGRQLRNAIDIAWERAWPSIRDSNLSTLITCGILYFFGSTVGASIVKGFSLTLAIGVLVSMFTAIIVTRTFLHVMLDNMKFTEHPKWFGVV